MYFVRCIHTKEHKMGSISETLGGKRLKLLLYQTNATSTTHTLRKSIAVS